MSVRHGAVSTYNRGCRCTDCAAAKRESNRRNWARVGLGPRYADREARNGIRRSPRDAWPARP